MRPLSNIDSGDDDHRCNVETRLLTVPEVAERLRVSRPTVYRRIADGSLPAVRIGERFGPLRVDERELEAWLYGEGR